MQKQTIKQYFWVAFLAFIICLPIVGFVLHDGAISATQWKLWFYQLQGKSPETIVELLDVPLNQAKNPIEIPFRISSMLLICGLSIPGAMLWNWLLNKKNSNKKQKPASHKSLIEKIDENRQLKVTTLIVITAVMAIFPWVVTNDYQVTMDALSFKWSLPSFL